MKYAALIAALTSSANGVPFAPCTDTWPAAAGCDAGEQCFDWQSQDKTTSNGLKCGLTSNCDSEFKYTDTTGGGSEEKSYYGACKGLSLGACTVGGAECDSVSEFKCADWTKADGTTQLGCAKDKTECGTQVASTYDVACSGLAGEACTSNTDCDAKVNKCTTEFNNQTYTFMDKTNVCMGMDMCGKLKNASDPTMNNTILLCYNEPATACSNTTTCEKPNGDEKDVACGYIAPGDGMHNMSSGMCVDATLCDDAAKGMNGTKLPYFGGEAKLWCGSARTALAMGAAVASAYLAM